MPRSVLDESYDPIYDQVRGILGEHFENYCFIVMNEEGQIFFDYNHLPAGKMLINEMQYEIRDDNLDIEWEFGNDLDDLEEEE
jgi:FKBP-type peptidyl-prolyl cis-trans isomerase 2